MARRYIRDAAGRFAEVPEVRGFEKSDPVMAKGLNYSVGSTKRKGYSVIGHPAEFKRQGDAQKHAEQIARDILDSKLSEGERNPSAEARLRGFSGNKTVYDKDPTKTEGGQNLRDATRVRTQRNFSKSDDTNAARDARVKARQADQKNAQYDAASRSSGNRQTGRSKTDTLEQEEASIREQLADMGSSYKVRDLQKGGFLHDRLVENSKWPHDNGDVTMKVPSGSEIRISKNMVEYLTGKQGPGSPTRDRNTTGASAGSTRDLPIGASVKDAGGGRFKATNARGISSFFSDPREATKYARGEEAKADAPIPGVGKNRDEPVLRYRNGRPVQAKDEAGVKSTRDAFDAGQAQRAKAAATPKVNPDKPQTGADASRTEAKRERARVRREKAKAEAATAENIAGRKEPSIREMLAQNKANAAKTKQEETAKNYRLHGFSPADAERMAKKVVREEMPADDKAAARAEAKRERARKRRAAAKGAGG